MLKKLKNKIAQRATNNNNSTNQQSNQKNNYQVNINPLPDNFTDRLFHCEMEVEKDPVDLEVVNELLDLYARAIEYYESQQNDRYLIFKNKTQTLLIRPNVLNAMNHRVEEIRQTTEPDEQYKEQKQDNNYSQPQQINKDLVYKHKEIENQLKYINQQDHDFKAYQIKEQYYSLLENQSQVLQRDVEQQLSIFNERLDNLKQQNLDKNGFFNGSKYEDLLQKAQKNFEETKQELKVFPLKILNKVNNLNKNQKNEILVDIDLGIGDAQQDNQFGEEKQENESYSGEEEGEEEEDYDSEEEEQIQYHQKQIITQNQQNGKKQNQNGNNQINQNDKQAANQNNYKNFTPQKQSNNQEVNLLDNPNQENEFDDGEEEEDIVFENNNNKNNTKKQSPTNIFKQNLNSPLDKPFKVASTKNSNQGEFFASPKYKQQNLSNSKKQSSNIGQNKNFKPIDLTEEKRQQQLKQQQEQQIYKQNLQNVNLLDVDFEDNNQQQQKTQNGNTQKQNQQQQQQQQNGQQSSKQKLKVNDANKNVIMVQDNVNYNQNIDNKKQKSQITDQQKYYEQDMQIMDNQVVKVQSSHKKHSSKISTDKKKYSQQQEKKPSNFVIPF